MDIEHDNKARFESITATNELAADGSLFIPHGDTEVIASTGERLIQRHDAAAMRTMADGFNSRLARFMRRLKGEVPVFLGHPDIEGSETAFPDKRARGYVEAMNAEDDGLRLGPEWTNLGAELRAEGRYRYPSPRWALELTGENVGGVRVARPVRLISVGMTDRPNIKRVIAYNSVGNSVDGEQKQEVQQMDKRLQFLLAWLGLVEASNEEEVKTAAERKLTAVNEAEQAKQKAVKDLVNERAAWATTKATLEGRNAELTQQLTAANELVRGERKTRLSAALVEAVNSGRLTAAQQTERLAAFTAEKLDSIEAVNTAIAEIAKLPKTVKTESGTGDLGSRKTEAQQSHERITAINTAVGEKMKASGLGYHEAYLSVKAAQPQLFAASQN